MSKASLMIFNRGNADSTRGDWVDNFEEAGLALVCKVKDMQQSGDMGSSFLCTRSRIAVEPHAWQRIRAVLESLQELHYLSASEHGDARLLIDTVAACMLMSQTSSVHVTPTDANRVGDSAQLEPISLMERPSYAESLENIDVTQNFKDHDIMNAVKRRGLHPDLVRSMGQADLGRALEGKETEVLKVLPAKRILEKAAEIIGHQLQEYTDSKGRMTGSTIQSLGKWTPDDKPEEGLQTFYDFLVTTMAVKKDLDDQVRVHDAEWLQNHNRNIKRASNLMLHMVLRARHPKFCAAQAALGILLDPHVPGWILTFFSTAFVPHVYAIWHS